MDVHVRHVGPEFDRARPRPGRSGRAVSAHRVPAIRPGPMTPAVLLLLQRTAGNRAVTVLRQSAPAAPTAQQQSAHNTALSQHTEQQQRFNRLITDGLAQSPGSTQELDRAALLRNACQWIASGRVETRVLTPTHDSATRRQGQLAFFDRQVAYSNVGGSYSLLPDPASDDQHLVFAPRGYQGVTTNHIIEIVDPASKSDDRLRTIVIHEAQHDLDQTGFGEPGASLGAPGLTGGDQLQSAGLFNNYQSEFRAHWIETQEGTPGDRYGSSTVPATNTRTVTPAPAAGGTATGPTTPVATHFANRRQEMVFWHLVDNGYGFETPYATDVAFRTMVDQLDRPRGVNTINSIRVRAVLDALGRSDIKNPPSHPGVQAVVAAFDALDSTDLVFLQSSDAGPFWSYAADRLIYSVLRRLRFRASLPVEDFGRSPRPREGVRT
jgi:hypothetical protein